MCAATNVLENKEARLPRQVKDALQCLASEWDDIVDSKALQVIPIKGRSSDLRRGCRGVLRLRRRDQDVRVHVQVWTRTRLLGRFPKGRIEEFLRARTLSAADLRAPDISALIAAKLRAFNELSMPGQKKVWLWDRLSPRAKYHGGHLDAFQEEIYYSKYPGLEERSRFLWIYLEYAGQKPGDTEVKQLLEDVEKYTLASHLTWGLWGIISLSSSGICERNRLRLLGICQAEVSTVLETEASAVGIFLSYHWHIFLHPFSLSAWCTCFLGESVGTQASDTCTTCPKAKDDEFTIPLGPITRGRTKLLKDKLQIAVQAFIRKGLIAADLQQLFEGDPVVIRSTCLLKIQPSVSYLSNALKETLKNPSYCRHLPHSFLIVLHRV
ncbi:Kinase superfamily protein isoform 5 [Hibiscus syriacus]|uniref:Kinase superfamily protein isoform 5 n=1 Tax=Hibiscus syriacus TaxID=106335 RepID=A0A6A2YSG8_HIBSY|nr:Kinase superfamily protein isoform 5 [Hibiscus syriacus]